ncbi:MAG: glycosyltransferase family 39 protein [Lachnospiraceae bacterium]|nr:glycosyltransferase family 39 protein [Lachnospiraceae bacterium]
MKGTKTDFSVDSPAFAYFYVAILFAFCFLVGRIGRWQELVKFETPQTITLTVLFSIPAACFLWCFVSGRNWKKLIPGLQFSMLAVPTLYLINHICEMRVAYLLPGPANESVFFWGILILFLAVSLLPLLLFKEGFHADGQVIYSLGCALLVRFTYITLMQGHIFENDMGTFEERSYGHIGYAYHLYAGDPVLSFSPIGYDQLYHPPLYHFLLAKYLKLQELTGAMLGEQADEIAQTFDFFLAGVLLLFLAKICVKLGVDAAGTSLVLACMTVIPYMIISSGATNNDPLACTLGVIAIYFGLCWRETHRLRDICLMGLGIGCSMMAKMSGAVLAFSMAVFMLLVVWKDRKEWKKYIGQFACFGLISGVCGLWHPIYNLVRFGVPLDYFPRVNETYDMFLPDFTKQEFLFDFKDGLMYLTPSYQRSDGYIEHNILLSVLKHATFNEGYNYQYTPFSNFLGVTCFTVVCILCAAFVICSAVVAFKKWPAWESKILIIGTTVANYLCLVKVVFAQPFVCTMNVRYLLLAICTGSITVGMALSGKPQEAPRRGHIVVSMLALLLFLIGAEWTVNLLLLFEL